MTHFEREDLIGNMELQVERGLLAIECDASQLLLDFRNSKRELIDDLKREMAMRRQVGERVRGTYLPLNFCFRMNGGYVELFWQNVHRRGPRSKNRYKYIRKSSTTGGYTRFSLEANVRGGGKELELVLETERLAQQIRKRWSALLKVRAALRGCRRLESAA